jgi:hypothetical protein
MLRQFDDLDRRVVADLEGEVRRQRDLRQAEGAVVLRVGGPDDAEDGDRGVAVVERLVAVAHVEVELRVGVAGEPAGLDGDGAALDGPFGAVGGGGQAAACGC